MITIYSTFWDKTGEPIYSVQDQFDNEQKARDYFDTVLSVAHQNTVLEETETKIKYSKSSGAVTSVQIGR